MFLCEDNRAFVTSVASDLTDAQGFIWWGMCVRVRVWSGMCVRVRVRVCVFWESVTSVASWSRMMMRVRVRSYLGNSYSSGESGKETGKLSHTAYTHCLSHAIHWVTRHTLIVCQVTRHTLSVSQHAIHSFSLRLFPSHSHIQETQIQLEKQGNEVTLLSNTEAIDKNIVCNTNPGFVMDPFEQVLKTVIFFCYGPLEASVERNMFTWMWFDRNGFTCMQDK